MHLKTSKTYAIEGAIQQEGGHDLYLQGSEYISIIDRSYEIAINNKNISSEQNSFFSVYGLDCKFFYYAQQIKFNKIIKYEVGIGYLEQIDGNFVLKRSQPLYCSENNQEPSPVVGMPRPFYCVPNEYLIVTTHIPRSYIELLTDDNCIITSVAPHIPSITYVKEDSIVGRFSNNIQSVPVSDIKNIAVFSQAIVDTLTNYTKQLTLKSSKIIGKFFSIDYLSIKPTDVKPPEKDGAFYFNKQNNSLCFYANNGWHKITSIRLNDETSS